MYVGIITHDRHVHPLPLTYTLFHGPTAPSTDLHLTFPSPLPHLCMQCFWSKNCCVPITEIDNPPVAKAGQDVIIKLPVDAAILYGNSSFDDHPEMAYEWAKISGPVADMSVSKTLS